MIEYSEEWLVYTIFKWRGSVAPRSCYFGLPAAILGVLLCYVDDVTYPGFREEHGLLSADKSQLWTASTTIIMGLLTFRINRAMARFWEGTGLLHQMRGEWFDSVSCCVTFSRGALPEKREAVMKFRHTLVRLMSLCHGSALKEIGVSTSDDCETIDPHGLDDQTLKHLQDCANKWYFNRVEVILHLIQTIITQHLHDGVLKIPPPILSRVYQTLSRGFVNLLNAKKIADTRFPFPFAQVISTYLFVSIIITPLVMSSLFTQPVMVFFFTFFPIWGMSALNFIGVELENPFGDDPNDLPLEHFQAEMNNCLMMLLHSSADIMPGVHTKRCLMNYETIRDSMQALRSEVDESGQVSYGKADASQANRHRITTFRAEDYEAEDFPRDTSQRESAADLEPRLDSRPASTTNANIVFGEENTSPDELNESKGTYREASAEEREEKLQPATWLKSLEKLVAALQDIKQAVNSQAGDVGRGVDAIAELNVQLEKTVGDSLTQRARENPQSM